MQKKMAQQIELKVQQKSLQKWQKWQIYTRTKGWL
jgi:hypothetical protein